MLKPKVFLTSLHKSSGALSLSATCSSALNILQKLDIRAHHFNCPKKINKQSDLLSINKCGHKALNRLTAFPSTLLRPNCPNSPYSNDTRTSGRSFPVIGEESQVDKTSVIYKRNEENFRKCVEHYEQAKQIALAGGGEKSIERHVKRHKKMLVTDRVRTLVDDVDDFLELSLIGGVAMEYGHVPRASILTGIGKIQGKYCLIIANDGAFKGGAVYPVTLKKQLRAQEIAAQNHLPCVYLVDSAGAFLPMQADIFNPGGQTFYNQAVLSSLRIPQIAIICGSCTAGGAYVPTMADEAVIVHKTGTIFLAGPPLVQAALGEIISAEELGGATVHCGTSGGTDYFAVSEPEAFDMGRRIVSSLNLSMNESVDVPEFEEPVHDVEEISGLIPPPDKHNEMNMYQIIARLVDASRFHEFKVMFGKSLLTGFAHIKGHLVGILANHGEINEDAAAKGAHFVQLCCERDIPIVFLQNTAMESLPQDSSKEQVIKCGTSLKSQARMLSTVSCASVPKLTVIVGNGFGTAHYIMGGRAVSPNFVFAWPNARVGPTEPEERVHDNMHASDIDPASEQFEEERKKLLGKLTKESSTVYGATRIYNDGIIMPSETRKVLSQCLSICKAYRPRHQEQDYSVLRM